MDKLKNKIYSSLRWSEKWAKTDMVYLAKGGSPLIIGKILISAAAFGLSIAYANLLPKDVYGTYKYVLSLAGIFTIFTLSGIETSLIRSIAKGFEGSLSSSLKTKIKWGLIGGFLSLFTSIYYFYQGNNMLAGSFFITAIFLPFMDSLAIYQAFLSGKKLFSAQAISSTANQVIFTLILISSFFLSQNVVWIILVYFGANTLLRFFTYQIIKNKYQPNNKVDEQTVSYGKHISFINLFGNATSYLDKILLWQFLGPSALAIYSIALAPANQLTNFLKTINSLALPKLAATSKEDLKKTLMLKIFKFIIVLIPGVLLYIFLAPYLFKIFFPQYTEAVIYSQIYFLIILFFPIRLLPNVFLAHAQKKELYISSFISNAIYILLLVILVPTYGLYGAVFALIISPIFNSASYIYLFKKM